MSHSIIELVEKQYLKPETPQLRIGDTIDVLCRIVEGDKERIQTFTGILIARKGRGINENITVRRMVKEEGVERIFPLHSPNVIDIKARRHGKVRRAKLYFLRDRVGKARKLRELRVHKKGSEGRSGAAPALAGAGA